MPNDMPDRIFRKLQGAYPKEFREEYGEQMALTFRERAADARRRGVLALVRFWAIALTDLIGTAAREHSEGWTQDISRAVRSLTRKRSLALVATLSLAIGIGATTTVFSVIDSVLLRPLPFSEPDRLFVVEEESGHGISFFNYLELGQRSRAFRSLAAFSYPNTPPTYTGGEVPLVLEGVVVTSTFFDVLGTAPEVGRVFMPDEDRPGVAPVIVLGHAFWTREMGADRSVVGSSMLLDGVIHRIVGVMPEGFAYPSTVDYWKPLQAEIEPPGRRALGFLSLVGRSGADTETSAVQADVDRLASILGQEFPEAAAMLEWNVESLHDRTVGESAFALWVLFLAVGLVLLIACTSVSSLLLSRGIQRQQEIAIRTALGARRPRVLRLLLSESLVLALAGGLAGALAAVLLTPRIVAMAPSLPRAGEVSADSRVLLFALTASVVCGVVCGVLPAFKAARTDVAATLSNNSLARPSARMHRLQRGLVVAQVAIAYVLLVGAGLLTITLVNINSKSPGFVADNVMSFRIVLPRTYVRPEQKRRFFDEVMAGIRTLPGVRNTSISAQVFRRREKLGRDFTVEGRGQLHGQEYAADSLFVGIDYFETMGIEVLDGRGFAPADGRRPLDVVLINEAMARRFWPGGDPVGARIKTGYANATDDPWLEVIGVVADARRERLDEDPVPEFYIAYEQESRRRRMYVLVASDGNPLDLVPAIRARVGDVDPLIAVQDVQLIEDLLAGSVAGPRFRATIMMLFASVAVVLSLVGIYGMLSRLVFLTRHEIGVRIAMGAPPSSVLRHVVGRGLRTTALGLVLGVMGALAASRLLEAMLVDVSVTSPANLSLTALLFVVVVLAASYFPARRASRLDPVETLRS